MLRSPADGVIKSLYKIGDPIEKYDIVAEINGTPVRSEINGVLRGICRDGIKVVKGQKIGDIDPRGKKKICHEISDKAKAIAGGVITALEQYSTLKVINWR